MLLWSPGLPLPLPSSSLISFSARRVHRRMEASGHCSAAEATGCTGTIDLGHRDADLTGDVHLLPCCIRQDGPCPVSHYFKPKPTGVEIDKMKVEEAFFRGRGLQGASICLPERYRGYVLGKKETVIAKDSEDAGDSNHWESFAEFGNLTYWNHDDLPSQDDAIVRSLHWLTVANALHKPVTAEDLARSLSNNQNHQ